MSKIVRQKCSKLGYKIAQWTMQFSNINISNQLILSMFIFFFTKIPVPRKH